MKTNDFENEVKKLYFKISGLEFDLTNPKWWKVKTSVKSMIETLYKIKGNFKELNFTYNAETNKFFVNGDLQGIVDSTFRQYFIIGYILGVFEIDKDIIFASSFHDYVIKKEKFMLTKEFCNKVNYQMFLIDLNLLKRIKEVIMWANPDSFIWEPTVKFVFTLCSYAVAFKNNSLELMINFLDLYKQKKNTKITGAIDEYNYQKEIAVKFANFI
ncbi:MULTISPECIES: hypothetical protein [Mesoplasma]|uniref:Uncharacterized protein n=1 Tax=Mesoplasma florum TaxID=2151 RepID=A0A2R3P7A4_MESFO|nr:MULTISPECIES: hypothetical protein [Mesoplasma]AVN64362.1 hypothetical protein CG003_01625 [Mesoplasma florum]